MVPRWKSSGIAALEDHLVLPRWRGEKRHWLEDAVRGKAADVLSQAVAELDLRLRALNLPIEELAAKADAFQAALRAIEEQRRVTGYLLAGDHRRLRLALDSRVDDLRREIAAKLAGVIDASLMKSAPSAWAEATQSALPAAMRSAFEAAREPLASAFASDTGAALAVCQDRINALVDRVRQAAAEIFDVPLGAVLERRVLCASAGPLLGDRKRERDLNSRSEHADRSAAADERAPGTAARAHEPASGRAYRAQHRKSSLGNLARS